MKNLFIILLLISTLSCKAQTIVPYFSDQEILVENSGDYYKDVDNNFNKFIGTWKWESGNNSLTIILKKEVQLYSETLGFYKDLLVGEYQYIENGIEKVNTLSQINAANISGVYHNISGMGILSKYNLPPCGNCDENERRLRLHIDHPDYDGVSGWLILRYVSDVSERIELIVRDERNISIDPNAPDNIDIPFGSYTLIKQ